MEQNEFTIFLNSYSSNVLMRTFLHCDSLTQLKALKEHLDYKIIYDLDMDDFDLDLYNQLERRIRQLHTMNGAIPSGACNSPNEAPSKGNIKIQRFKNISLGCETDYELKKFNMTARRITFCFNEFDGNSDPISWIKEGINDLVTYGMRSFQPDDRVGMVFNNSNFPDRPLPISFRRKDQLSPDTVLDTFGNALQSNANFFMDNDMSLTIYRVRLPSGGGGSRNSYKGTTFKDFCRQKTSIVAVDNSDNHCLAYALVLGIAHRENEARFAKLKYSPNQLTEKGKQLCLIAGVDLSQGANYDHIKKFQDFLAPKYTIVVYNNRKGSSTYFEGPRSPQRQVINILLEKNHYNLILSLTGAFATAYFCEMCKRRYNGKQKHVKCPYACPCCHATPPCDKANETITCQNCNRTFRGDDCLNAHRNTLCAILKRCKVCLYSYWVGDKKSHKCGEKYCLTCMEIKPIRHLCFMKPKAIAKKNQDLLRGRFLFVFYDLECRQEKALPGDRFLHEPNLCVAEQVCAACIDNDDIKAECNECGVRLHLFKKDPVGELLEYLHKFETKRFKVTAIAHNMKGYDGCFVARRVLSDVNRWNPALVRNGCKFISITCNNIRFIDSLNYMPLPLSKLPSAFKFEGSKGYFPHLFNKNENRKYVGPLPDESFYMPDSMGTMERAAFYQWYIEETSKKAVFRMKTEIVKYCVMDVEILRKACVKFRRCFLETNQIDPFQEAATIASACNLVYRRNFLEPDTIGIIPQGGYRLVDKQSDIALKWLVWVEHTLDAPMIHAGNSREVRLREGVLVDGFCESTNTVYEFQGCYYHGCQKCFANQTTSQNDKNDLIFMRREYTEAREKRLLGFGYKVETMWECDFRELMKSNPDINKFLKRNYAYTKRPLNPRDAFVGGRTNAVKLYYKCTLEDEKICYFDVCSLYPYVNKYGKYPVGHPRIIIGDAECQGIALGTLEGLVKCTVLPPTNLYHPVLPYKCNGKLMFPLCREEECRHSEVKRKFTGTFVADELRKALSLGYQVLDISEIWQYDVEIYDKRTKSGGLFAKYVDNFLKIKQECSGWPTWCTSDELKRQYVEAYAEREGIQLDPSNISHNAGMRYISKLMLNSFWGKFGQRENLMQTSVIRESMQLFNLLTDPAVVLHDLIVIDDDTLLACWDKNESAVTPLRTVNVVLAAYTTASARLELYNYLEKLGDRVLYFDTDSIVFTHRPGQWMPETGDYLGQLTDEMAEYGPGSKIVEFVSGGPKNYAMKIFSTNRNDFVSTCKVKGITLNFKNSKTVNFDSLKAMVCDGAAPRHVFNERKIARTKTYDVISKREAKIFRVSYTKRRRIDNYDTLPYGYRI